MANQYVNKVVINDEMGMPETKLDLTADTVVPSQVLEGATFHDKSGASQTGTLGTLSEFAYIDASGNTQTATWRRAGEMQTDKNCYLVTIKDPQKIDMNPGAIAWDDDMYATATINVELSGTQYTLEDNDAGGQTLTIG